MKCERYKLKNEYALWNTERFSGKKSAYIRLDFHTAKLSSTATGIIRYQLIDDCIVAKLARRFRVEFNQFCFGNAARRYNKQLVVVAAIHKLPHLHLHVQAEIPDRYSILNVKSFTDHFALKNSWIKDFPHVSEARSDIRSQIYNSRFGSDTIIDF